jgi:hypothetical protein
MYFRVTFANSYNISALSSLDASISTGCCMPIAKRDLRECLMQKFGFQEVQGARHEAVALFVSGKKVATARFSRSHATIDDTILQMIAREIWVQTGYLKKMYGCTKSRNDYLDLLGETGHLAQ